MSSAVVTAKPNGKVRVCIDPRPLNKALHRSHYPLPVIDDILPDLGKARVFSKADLKDGFLQIDDESSCLTTFQTPWGRHRWLRMPYGISPAPEYFQQKLDQNLQGVPGVFRIADVLLITGQGNNKEDADKDHDANLVRLLQRCRERNIRLNKAKFDFKCLQVTFIGHLLSSEGVKPDPRKIDGIVNMETPVDVQGVQRLIGMVKFRSSSLTCLSYVSLSASLPTMTLSGSGHRNKNAPFSPSKWLLHKRQSSSISAQKPKLKDKVMDRKMALDLS